MVVYVVEGDPSAVALPSATLGAEMSPPYLARDSVPSGLAGSIPTLDVSASGCAESFSRLPRKLPGRETATRRPDSPVSQEVASIDANVALSFRQTSQFTTPTLSSLGDGGFSSETSSDFDPDAFDDFLHGCVEVSWSEADDGFSSETEHSSSADGFSSGTERYSNHGLTPERDDEYAGFSCVVFDQASTDSGSLDVESTPADPSYDWDAGTESLGSSESSSPALSVGATMQRPELEFAQLSSAEALLDWNPSRSSQQQHKRKHLQIWMDPPSSSGPKKACSRPLAGFATLGLCAVLGGLVTQKGMGGFAPSDAAERCVPGPARIAHAVDDSVCPEGTQGTQCPYECLGGFTTSGSHTCTREASGRVRYTGGACIPSSPCQGGVTLVDSGPLSLLPDSTDRQCAWDLRCTNKSLAPMLRFAGFSMGSGYLSITGGPRSDLGGSAQTTLGPNSPHVADLRETYGGHLWQPGSPGVSKPSVILLRGDDAWWISQKPIRVAPSPAVSVLYNTNASNSAREDSFIAAFSCAPFEELCTATDTMELDWVGVVHAPPEGFSYPSHLVEWATLADHLGWPPAASACTSSPCVHGACVDSDSQQAYSEQTAFGFVCNCHPSWSGELCENPSAEEHQRLPCAAAEDDCDDTVSSCAVLGPGQHECVCFPGFTNASPGESSKLKAKSGMHAANRCKLEVEDPAVGPSWVSGPGYDALNGVIVGSFEARVGESPAYLQASSFIENSAFFDPAAYNQVLLSTPASADGCSVDAYGGPGTADKDMEYVMVLSSDGGCPLWLKVIIAQRMAAKSVIIYGDGMPAGSAISWAIDDPARLASAINDPYDVGGTAQQLGLS